MEGMYSAFQDQSLDLAANERYVLSNGPSQNRMSTIRSTLALVGIAVAFVTAKHITTAGAATLDQFGYWLISLLPVLFYVVLGRSLSKSNHMSLLREIGIRAWALSLIIFIAFRVFHFSQSFELAIYAAIGARSVFFYFCISTVYALIGVSLSAAISLARHSAIQFREFAAASLLAYCATVFFLFLFLFAL
jgi:hypothetical protein